MCSELVSEVFWNPSDAHGTPYGLPIKITNRHKLKSPVLSEQLNESEMAEMNEFLDEVEAAFEEAMPGFGKSLDAHCQTEDQILSGAANGTELIGGSSLLPSMCVTPCDLQRSPALRLVGNYIQDKV